MNVKDVIVLASEELGLPNGVKDFLNGGLSIENESFAECEKTANDLLRCFNLVENEIALDYLPLTNETEAESATGIIEYSSLSDKLVRVLGVTGKNGVAVGFKSFPAHFATVPGRVKIRYSYTPREKNFNDCTEFTPRVSSRLLAFGVASEYCLAKGMFEDACVWDKKYKDALKSAVKGEAGKVLRAGRWI